MTINTFEEALLLPKYEKINASIIWKSGIIEERRITNEGTAIFVYDKRKKKYGTRIREDDFLRKIERIEIKEKKRSEDERWLKSWKRAEEMLEESGLWADVLKSIKDGIEIGYDKIVKAYRIDFGDLPKTEEGTYQDEQKRKEQLIGEIDERLKDVFIRWYMSRPAVIKKMNFGPKNEVILEDIKQAIKEKRPHTAVGQNNYDISFDYSPEFNRAWYSEEYRNCGNGHYYLALNNTHALFYEDD